MTVRFAALVLATFACVPGSAVARKHAAEPSTGLPAIRFAKPAPDFAFRDAGETQPPDGTFAPQRLDDFRGKPVVINFWASWCEPCQSEIGAFAELARIYGDAVPLVAVSEDTTPGAAEAYLHAHAVPAISVDDPERKIFALYTVVPIPTTLVLAPDGTVTHVSIGALDWDELRTAVDGTQPGRLTLPGAFGTLSGNAGTPKP